MPPASKINASVILYDVNTSPELAEAAKKCLLNICASKWFLESKDRTKLILLNTNETNNSIHTKFGKCPHVLETPDGVVNYDPKLLKVHIEDVQTAEADWLMGLAVAIEALQENFFDSKGVMTLQLLFITDFSTVQPVHPKQKRIEFVIQNLNKMKVFLYILGPEVKIPRHMSSFEDIQKWSKEVEFVTNEEENPNLSIAKQIVENTNGIICDLELGQELFKSYTNRWGLQPWKVPLSIGTTTFSTSTTRFLRPVSGPKIKKRSIRAPWKWQLIDDESEDVAYEDIIGGVCKHNIFVPLPEDVERNFKYNGLRCFKIIGFTDKSNVSEFYMRGSGSCYVESDSKGFKLLVQMLDEQNKCAIARRVYMANCRPKLVALLPNVKDSVLILVELPYKDNIRVSMVEQDIDEAPELDDSNPLVDVMYEYLQKLDVSDPTNKDENDRVKVPLSPSLMDSLRRSLVTRRCLQKYLGNEIDTEEINVKLPQITDDANYKEFIPVRSVVEPKKRTKD